MADIPDFNSLTQGVTGTRTVQTDEAVVFSYRGWLAALAIFVFLCGFPAGVIVHSGLEFAGWTSLVYIFAGVGAILTALCALHRKQFEFDFGRRSYRFVHGFIGIEKEQTGSFDDISAIVVREIRRGAGASPVSGERTRVSVAWGIGLEAKPKSPASDILEAPDRETAQQISDSLAGQFGCETVWEDEGQT